MPKFPVNKGFKGFVTDDEAWLRPSQTNPYEASASGVGYNASKDDDAGTHGHGHGDGTWAADNDAFLRPSYTGDVDYAHQNLGSIPDDVDGMGSGNKLTGGGGPLTKDYGVSDGKPRFAPKKPGHQKGWGRR
jgi:hypothetical protein